MGQWGLRGARDGASYDELVEAEGLPRLRMWLDRIHTESLAEFAVTYGYWPCHSEGNTLVVGAPDEPGREVARFTFPRQRRDRRLCLADFFRSKEAYEADGRPDVISFQLVTMGEKVSGVTGELYAQNAYRDYLELHGLSVQLTEALAEFWHARVRSELGFADSTELGLDEVLDVRFRGCRYSFGYPACPDLTDQTKVMALLEPERIGVELSEEFQLHPEQSTSALVAHHPEAKYFAAR
jgi:5-methyltetrahydrofolate--homocysteine methyltransferase